MVLTSRRSPVESGLFSSGASTQSQDDPAAGQLVPGLSLHLLKLQAAVHQPVDPLGNDMITIRLSALSHPAAARLRKAFLASLSLTFSSVFVPVFTGWLQLCSGEARPSETPGLREAASSLQKSDFVYLQKLEDSVLILCGEDVWS